MSVEVQAMPVEVTNSRRNGVPAATPAGIPPQSAGSVVWACAGSASSAASASSAPAAARAAGRCGEITTPAHGADSAVRAPPAPTVRAAAPT